MEFDQETFIPIIISNGPKKVWIKIISGLHCHVSSPQKRRGMSRIAHPSFLVSHFMSSSRLETCWTALTALWPTAADSV